ncbi:hypothetical protein Tco_0255886 [Tanacetum coccineum]
MTRSTETSDGLAAIQAQLNNLGREIKKVNEKERRFGSLPISTEANPRDHVNLISTTVEAGTNPIRRASVSVMPLSTYLNLGLGELAHTKLTVELADRTVKYPKGIAKNMQTIFSTAHAKINVFKKKITLRVRDEKIIFKSMKPANSLFKRVYMLGLRECMKLDLEARLMRETLVLNRSLDPLYMDYIELNDLTEPLELRRDQVDDLMPTIEEGEVIDEPMIDIIKTRNNENFVEFPSFCDFDWKIHIDCAYNLRFLCMIGFEHVSANFFPIVFVNVMSIELYNSIIKDKVEYKGKNVDGAFMNVPIFIGNFSVITHFIVVENMDGYRDQDMGDIILGEPFCKASCVEERRFDGLITIHYGSDNVTYQMARSHPMFKHLSNAQCNKIKSLLKDLAAKKSTKLVKYRSYGIMLIMEYLVKNNKKARNLEVKRRHLNITVLTSNTPYPSRKITYLCLHFTKDHEGNKINMPYLGKTNTPYSSYGNNIFWKISNVVPTPRNPQYADSSYLGLRKKYRLSLKNDMPPRDKKLLKTQSLDESRSPEFNLFSDLEEYSEEEVAETMAETMEQYMSKTRADYGSGIARPKIDDKDSFELKGQFLKELRDNTFSGSDHEDANEHIEKVLEIVDLFHIPNITQDQVMLRAFPMSLTGAASRWLRNKPSGSITTWEDLKTKFLSKYCPPARTAKKMEEINNFQQEPDETLYQAWERFKELLMKCPQHYLTEMQEVILFYNGLDVQTRQILDSKGAIPSKTVADAKVAIQEMAEYSQKWHNGTSRTRSTETSDGLAAIQAQLNNLGREIKKVNEKVYAAQVGCEQCKGPHYTKDCPLKEEGKTLEEAYYTQFGGPFQGGGYRAAAPGFYQRNNANPSYQERRQSMEETLSKFMSESTKRHEENSNMIKEIQASTDAAVRNQGASIKTLEIQIGQISKVLQERGFGSLPSSTEANPRDHVKSISTTAEADSNLIRHIGSPQYAVSTPQNRRFMFESRQMTIPFPSHLNDYYNEEKNGSYRPVSVMPLSTYLNLGLGKLAHTKLTVELADRTVKYPKGITKNMLVGIGKFVFPVEFIIPDMPEDVNVPLILKRLFLSTAHAKIDVFKRKITLRLRRDQIDDLMPTIEEGEKIHIDCAYNLRFACMIGFKHVSANFFPILSVNMMSREFYNSIIKDKVEHKRKNVVGAFMNVPIFVRNFSVITRFVVVESMDGYQDQDMGDIILEEPFCRASCVEANRFDRLITIHNGSGNVTYQMARSHPRFKHLSNAQCNKIKPLLKVSLHDKLNEISHPYQKLKSFYKGVLNLGPEYIRDAKMEEWLKREHISVHEME